MSLSVYNKRRDFKQTAEPKGTETGQSRFRFVVQRHEATRLHYDFRLELGGVLKSWAVPKGPSRNPATKRLAVMVEDHPVDYVNFKGTIPEGNYGAGHVDIWDSGKYIPVNADHKEITEQEALAALKKGELKFKIAGKKLNGEFVLVRLKNDEKNWLLIKHKDKFAVDVIDDAEDLVAPKKPVKKKGLRKKSSAASQERKYETIKAGKFNVPVTNLQKIFWPDEGYTKGDVISYYESMAKYILPHLKNRPLSLKRNPNGIKDEGFFHKDAGENAPDYAAVYKVKSGSNDKIIDYIVCNNPATLLYLANLGCIEINPWNSTTKKIDHPTWMVIDIDPSAKNSFNEVIDTALVTREVLKRGQLEGFCKTSGSSGLHVYVPMNNRYDYTTVKDFSQIIASLVQEQLPETTTLERSLSKRGPRIYIDWLQNRTAQTLASVYSLRPKPGATVSTPLDWKEVNQKLHPSQFTIENILARVSKKGDLFAPVLTAKNDIRKALKLLQNGR